MNTPPADLIKFAYAAVSREGLHASEPLAIAERLTSFRAAYSTTEMLECPGDVQNFVIEVAKHTELSRGAILDTMKFIYGQIGKCSFLQGDWDWIYYFDELDECQKFFLACSWGLCQIPARIVLLDLWSRGATLAPEQWVPAIIEFYRSPTAEFELVLRALKATDQKTPVQRFNYYFHRLENPGSGQKKLLTVSNKATDVAQAALKIKEFLDGPRRTTEEAKKRTSQRNPPPVPRTPYRPDQGEADT